MYLRMMSSGAPPHDAAKYDGDHKWSLCVRTEYRLRSNLDEAPLSEFTILDSSTVGGYDTSRWTWSSSPSISIKVAS